jgi:3-hydroxyisobutyrate dehydrogenase-like beta-hydroxyacid dehydrogenase
MQIGFIGTGTMGNAMARQLLGAGHTLVVHDLRRAAAENLLAAGASWADSPRAVAAQTEVVFGSLPKPADVERVLLGPDGLVEGAAPGLTYFDLTTSEPLTSRRLAAALAQRGLYFLDAPVSGGKAGAERGALAIMVGGDRAKFEQYRPLLESIGKNIFYMGDVGAGNVAKLVNNMIAFINRTAAVEGLLLGAKAGVDPQTLLECVNASSGQSASMGHLAQTLLKRNFAPSFTLDLAAKDMNLALELARDLRVPLLLAPPVFQLMIAALSHPDWAQQSSMRMATLQEQAAGIELRGRD